jgi:hypothetical protein
MDMKEGLSSTAVGNSLQAKGWRASMLGVTWTKKEFVVARTL